MTEEYKRRLREMAEAGMTATEIANELGYSPLHILKVRQQMGIHKRGPGRPRKFSREEGMKMAKMVEEGKSINEVSRIFGTSSGTVVRWLYDAHH